MTTLPPYAVDFRGHPACPCQAEWIPAFEAELQRRGILTGPIHIYQLIGGAPESAGAHVYGGAGDFLDLPGDEDVWVARQMGADATWARPTGWDGPGSIAHIHSVLTGCPHALRSTVAANQIPAVRDGFNGLGHLGRGGPDTGPRPLSGRTWREGIQWAQQQQEEDMPTPRDVWDEPIKAADDRHAGVALGQTWQTVQQLQADVASLKVAVEALTAAVNKKIGA